MKALTQVRTAKTSSVFAVKTEIQPKPPVKEMTEFERLKARLISK